MNKIDDVVKKLKSNNKTISTMESCTGGGLVNAITNISGASSVISFSAVTYSNEYKVKMGVSKEIIDKYSVYSKETAQSMAKAISDFTLSDYGVGITGKLGVYDPKNLSGDDDTVFVCIYDRINNKYNDIKIKVNSNDRKDDKLEVIEKISDYFMRYISE